MTFTGVLAPIPTPFNETGACDADRLRRALTRWMATPLAGVVVLGTSGEAHLVDDDEADRVVGVARECVPADRAFIVGAGRESTACTIRAVARAARLGADAVLVRTPGAFRNQMTDEALTAHYTAVADAATVPVLLYNFPALTGVCLSAGAVARLATHPNIVGIKDSSGDVAQIAAFAAAASDSFTVLSGSGSTFDAAVSCGAGGGILALACVLPAACVELFGLARAGEGEAARMLQARLLSVARLIGAQYGIPGLKAAACLAGYDVGVPRLPLAPAPPEAVGAIAEALRAFQTSAV
ncbi:MAG: dihydrodipicolinate synthase family protein [Acidobacteriota bacterium]